MHLVIQKNRGVEYVSFRESFWDPVRKKSSSRTVKNFGRLDALREKDPDILEKLRAEVERLNSHKDQVKQATLENRLERLHAESKTATNPDADNRTLMIGACAYRQIWNKLGMPRKLRDLQKTDATAVDIPDAAFYMVAARSLMPDSKLGQWSRRNTFLYGGSTLKLSHLYRTIDKLEQHRRELIRYINRQIAKHYDRVVTVALYDVTTYWFESQDADTLRNFGFSKDNKINQVQVVMGLLIDQNGIPIDYELFPGNTSEYGTMIPILRRLKEEYNLRRVIVTADRGLNSGPNLQQIRDMGLDYVIAYRLRNSGDAIRKLVTDENGWTYRRGSTLCDQRLDGLAGNRRPADARSRTAVSHRPPHGKPHGLLGARQQRAPARLSVCGNAAHLQGRNRSGIPVGFKRSAHERIGIPGCARPEKDCRQPSNDGERRTGRS